MFDESFYREQILDHYKCPRNSGTLEGANAHAEGQNPLCGDELQIDLRLDGDRIEAIRFSGQGCAISQAATSMLTEQVTGKTADEVASSTDAVNDAQKSLDAAKAQLADLQNQLATASEAQTVEINKQIATLQSDTIPNAQKNVDNAKKASTALGTFTKAEKAETAKSTFAADTGEFLGNLTPTGNTYVANTSFNGYTSSPSTATGNYQPPVYEDLIAADRARWSELRATLAERRQRRIERRRFRRDPESYLRQLEAKLTQLSLPT